MAMEKLGQLAATGNGPDLSHPTEAAPRWTSWTRRTASTVLDGRIIRLLSAPASPAVSHPQAVRGRIRPGSPRPFDESFARAAAGRTRPRSCRRSTAFRRFPGAGRRGRTRCLRSPAHRVPVVRRRRPDALREARLRGPLASDGMPLAGLVVNRPTRCWHRTASRPVATAHELDKTGTAPLPAAILALHAEPGGVGDQGKKAAVGALHQGTPRKWPVRRLTGIALRRPDLDRLREIYATPGQAA